MGEQRDQEQDDGHEKHDFCDAYRRSGNSTETENGGDEGDDK